MSESPVEETLHQRIEQRLQMRYVRWLARNKPETFCYWASVRNYQRFFRRLSVSFWRLFDAKLPEWIVLVLGGAVVIVFVVGAVFVIGASAVGYFHLPPSDVEQLAGEDQARFGFFRLAVIQFAALLTFILIGVTVRDTSEEKRDFHRLLPGDRRRTRIGMIQFFAGAMVIISWIAAIVIPLDLPSYGYAVIATGLTGTILFWSSHWVSRWLGLVEIPWEGKVGEGLGECLGMLLCLFAFLFALLPENVEYVRHLTSMLPTGWLNDQAREMGEGNLAHAWPLVGSWGVLLAVGLVARRQTKTWWHRHRVLRRIYASSPESKPSKKRKEFPLADIPADFRRRLRGMPTSWHEWLLPDWSRTTFALLATIAVCCLALQGVAYSVHLVISQLADPSGPVDRTDLVLFHAAISIMVLTVEVCGLIGQDRVLRTLFERESISPWGLWKRFQRNGLVRLPSTVLLTLPVLILPTIVKQGDPTLPMMTLGLSLSSAFALRALVAAMIVQQGVYRELYELVGGAFLIVTLGLGCGTLVLIMLATMPDLPGSYPVAWRQLAAQVSSLLLLFAGTQVWCLVPRLATGILRR
ncbi:hypothetical protein [Bremerella sp.]|uniref:hypothetical protein n=1 Tax=Bremerella sp. TaxID=2795602 RepID=UPI00391C0424